MRRLAIGTAALALFALTFHGLAHYAQAAPLPDELLRINSRIVYTVPETGSLSVTWQIDLENNDSATAFGGGFVYNAVTLPILRGASSVQASRLSGGALTVAVDDGDDSPLSLATITFDRELLFGDRYSFVLSYDLVGARSEAVLITEAYVYFPAIVAGDGASVAIEAPEGREWDVTIEPLDCQQAEETPEEFSCAGSENLLVAALVEVTRPDALQSIERSVPLQGGPLDLTISYFPGEEDWAQHIQELAVEALPLLEELFGFAYQGPTSITISERGKQEIAGYEGTFGCLPTFSCSIGISPVASDATAVHEFAHLWTQIFENRWLAEGLAQFMSLKAAEDLTSFVPPPEGVFAGGVPLALDEWGSPGYLLDATDEELAREDSGYLKSRRLFETLEEVLGLEAVQTANAAASEHESAIDSEEYLDLLEDTSGVLLDSLFLERVFPDSFAPTLEFRKRLRAQVVEVQEAAAFSGLELPPHVADLVADWKFTTAERLLEQAEEANAAYDRARARVEASRSLWTKLGLLGKDPAGMLQTSADSFHDADFERARERAESAQAMIDDAERTALIRSLIGAGITVAFLAAAAGAFWFLRRGSAEA